MGATPKDPTADHGERDTVRKTALASIAVTVLGAVVGLAVVDRWVGWLDRHQGADAPGMLQESREFGWVNRPGFRSETVRIDSLGLRNEEIPADAPADEVRILCLGDSRIHGSGVADDAVFTAALEQRMRAAGDAVRVLNGGVNSYTTLQCAQRALALLPTVQPDLVLIFASPGWTLRPNKRVGDWVAVGDRLVPGDIVESWPPALRSVPATWHQWLLSSHIYQRHRAVVGRGGDETPEARHFVLSRAQPPEAVREFLEGTQQALGLLSERAEALGIEVRLVLMPETFQIAPHIWKKYLLENAATGAPPPGTSAVEPMAVLMELVVSAGAESWTLYQEVLRFMSDVDRYYQDDEAHWNAAGHGAMAEALDRLVREAQLLDRLRERRAASPR